MKLIGAVLSAALVLAVVGCGDSVETTNISGVSKLGKREVADVGKQGTSGGDISSFSNTLTDGSGKKLGTIDGYAVTLPDSGDGERRASTLQFTLAGGRIVSNGIYEVGEDGGRTPTEEGITTAITGGTGDYKDAGGETTAKPSADGNIEFELKIETPK